MPRHSSTSSGAIWFPPKRLRGATICRFAGFHSQAKPCPNSTFLEPTHPLSLAAITARGYNPHVAGKDTNAMRLNVLFFGRLKDTIGHGQESMEIAVGSSIEDLFVECVARYPELGAHRAAMAVSRNREFAAWTTPLEAG